MIVRAIKKTDITKKICPIYELDTCTNNFIMLLDRNVQIKDLDVYDNEDFILFEVSKESSEITQMQELECKNKKSDDKDIIERMAGYISILDIDRDKDICKNIPVKKCNEFEMCEDCIIDYFSKKCYWEQDEFCVNDNSEHLADFVFPRRCGACNCFIPFKY